TGPVASLAPHYAAAKVVALPIVAGAGIAIKTLEAIAAGKALVGTPLAFRGLPHGFVPPVPAEPDAVPFAAAIARLINDPMALEAAREASAKAHQVLGFEHRFAEQMSHAILLMMKVGDVLAIPGPVRTSLETLAFGPNVPLIRGRSADTSQQGLRYPARN